MKDRDPSGCCVCGGFASQLRNLQSFISWAASKSDLCSRGEVFLSPKVVCYTSIFEKIAKMKDCQCFCSEDVQNCEKMMENYLPAKVILDLVQHLQNNEEQASA